MRIPHPRLPLLRATGAALLALLAACSSDGLKGVDIVGPSRNFPRFPSQAIEGIVYVQARLADQQKLFDADLVAEHGVFPLVLTLQLKGQGQSERQIRLEPERLNLRMYLPDGGVLAPLSHEEVAAKLEGQAAANASSSALRGGLLGTEANRGLVYFRLDPQSYEASGRNALHVVDGRATRFDLANSLLAFDINVEDEIQTFFVGIER